jgi:hypothetical protein
MSKKGLEACEAAIDRLLKSKPRVAAYIDVESSEITPAMVSVEAGFDKGYLKRAREAHKPLIKRIGALNVQTKGKEDSVRLKLKKALKQSKKARSEKDECKVILDNVLTQNLMLLERVRELEKELAKYQTSL